MKILFLHGWQSTPGGVKPTYLMDHGHEVLNPALPGNDFAAAVRIAQAEFDQHHPDVVIGSSRGGAVAMNLNSGSTPLVLLCPAWKHWGTSRTVKPGTIILHSQADDVVPFAHSQELLRNSGMPESALVVVGSNHRLADPGSLQAMLDACEREAVPKIPAILQDIRARFRFGIDTLLTVTVMYAVLFGVLRALRCPAADFIVISLLFTMVGLGQALLFKDQRPARASMIMGACFFVSLGIFYRVIAPTFVIILGMPGDPVEGAICGYVCGRLIAGAFLVSDKVNSLLRTSER